MPKSVTSSRDPAFLKNAVEAAVQIGLIALLVIWCIDIVKPFVALLVWGVIIAIAIYPLHQRIVAAIGGRHGYAAGLTTLVLLAALVIPSLALSGTLVETAHRLSTDLSNGRLTIPPPPDMVAGWPIIGERLHEFWQLASDNLQAALVRLEPELVAVGKWGLKAVAGAGLTALQFILSIIVAGVLLKNATGCERVAHAVATRLMGERGAPTAALAGATVRSVAQGVLGIALIQALLAGLGLLVVGVPGAGLWALLVLIVAVVQLPPLLILGPIIIYVFYTASTTTAVLFAIWSVVVGFSDTFLKPVFLGRGLDCMPSAPMGQI